MESSAAEEEEEEEEVTGRRPHLLDLHTFIFSSVFFFSHPSLCFSLWVVIKLSRHRCLQTRERERWRQHNRQMLEKVIEFLFDFMSNFGQLVTSREHALDRRRLLKDRNQGNGLLDIYAIFLKISSVGFCQQKR